MVQSVDNKAKTKIVKCGRGSAFFSSDFITFGESKLVAKSLERLTNAGTIIHVAHGVYFYLKIDNFLGVYYNLL